MDPIDIADLEHGFGGPPVLSLPRWRVAARGQAVVTGPSGSGKTTLLHILAGLTVPDRGEVAVAGHRWAAMAPAARDRLRGRTVGFVFQSFHPIRALGVLDNLRLARRLAGRPRDDGLCRRLLDELGIGALAGRRPAALSRGEGQRAAIARALAVEPALILADEPTSALDADNAALVARLLRARAAAGGAALVVATHDERIAGLFGERLALERRP